MARKKKVTPGKVTAWAMAASAVIAVWKALKGK